MSADATDIALVTALFIESADKSSELRASSFFNGGVTLVVSDNSLTSSEHLLYNVCKN